MSTNTHAPKLIRGMDGAAEYITEHHFPCTERYVKEITNNGTLPYYKVAGRRHYDPADIAAWVESRRIAARKGGVA